MRAVLLSRPSSRPEPLKRVTVLACDALSVDLDEPVEAVVMINVMYALEPDYRKRLGRCWRLSWHPPVCWSSPGTLWPAGAPSFPGAGFASGAPAYLHGSVGDSRVGGKAFPARYLYRVTEGEKVISEE
jgi:hypothetical protein